LRKPYDQQNFGEASRVSEVQEVQTDYVNDNDELATESLHQLDDDDSQEIIYTLNGVQMRTIQIEGEDQQYLMDPEN
jgi:hypothetical protein